MATKTNRGLGKGLGAFFGDEVVQEVVNDKAMGKNKTDRNEKKADAKGAKDQAASGDGQPIVVEKTVTVEVPKEITVKLSMIEPNREQPRKDFNEEQLQELADSIKQYGVLQPLLVQKRENYYELIAGERRWRAAKLAGLKEVPVVIREYTKQESMEIALIENVQRADLNPIEEAKAYQRLMQEFGLRQEDIAQRVSKNRATITNSMRLLKLAEEVQQMLAEDRITGGHARALLAIEDPVIQVQLAEKVEKDKMSVRDVERMVKLIARKPRPKTAGQSDEALELIFKELEERMKTAMGTKVVISRKDRNKGRIEIEYYSESELERIVELIESIR